MKINKTKFDIAFKLILSLSFILVAISVSYYFFFFLPKIEQGKLDLAIQEQQRKAQIEAEEEKQRQEMQAAKLKETKTKAAKANLEYCLDNTERLYSASWDSSCETHIKTYAEKLKDCLAYYSTESLCDIYKVNYDSNGTCLLPSSTSETIEKHREKNKEECYRKYELEIKAIDY